MTLPTELLPLAKQKSKTYIIAKNREFGKPLNVL